VRKTRFRPRFRSYVCRHRPTEVVIWKEVFPNGIDVNGTAVEDTRPMVYSRLALQLHVGKKNEAYPEGCEDPGLLLRGSVPRDCR
jgi:hypothetical protein